MADDTDAMTGEDDRGMDALLRDAARVGPGDALAARVLRDAEAVQDGFADRGRAPPRPRLARRFGTPPALVAALGGWGGFGGVTAAGLVGLAVGFWSPDLVDTIGGGALSFLDGGNAWAPDISELALETGDV